jgi:hypothetical protein
VQPTQPGAAGFIKRLTFTVPAEALAAIIARATIDKPILERMLLSLKNRKLSDYFVSSLTPGKATRGRRSKKLPSALSYSVLAIQACQTPNSDFFNNL